jgi:hypothetical protein
VPAAETENVMVFDKIKEVFSGGGDGDLGDMADKVGLGAYSQYLEGVTFPIGKDDLLVALQDNGAQEAIMEHVRSLPQDRFGSAQEVFKNLMSR